MLRAQRENFQTVVVDASNIYGFTLIYFDSAEMWSTLRSCDGDQRVIVFEDINQFWKTNQANGLHTILYAYSLGKAQRLIAGIDHSIGPVAVHSAVEKMNQLYIDAGKLNHQPPNCTKEWVQECSQPGLIIAPPAVIGSSWLKKLTPYREAYVSGWMLSKGQVRRRNMHGFVLSDHADWHGLNHAVKKMNPSKNILFLSQRKT